MIEFLRKLFDADFMPHGHCYFWRPEIVWLHVISDCVITLSYYSIPVALLYFVRRRKDLSFSWMFLMFATFIFACGTTHIMEVWTLWKPVYRLSGVVKLATASISSLTAVMLAPLIPKALALRSPGELAAANQALEEQIARRVQAEEELRTLNEELEQRVLERTAQLEGAKRELEAEIVERKKIEQSLQQQTELLASILDSMKQGVVVADKQGQLLVFNRGAEKLFGEGFAQSALQQWLEQCGVYQSDMKTLCTVENFPLTRASHGQVIHTEEFYISRPPVAGPARK